MPSVAEVWLADDLALLAGDPSPRLQADLYRCARETGFTPGRIEWSDQPYAAHHAIDWTPAHGGASVRMRVSVYVPVIGFVESSVEAHGWGLPYLDAPPLTSWWQCAGWLLPDPAWLNAPFTAAELEGVDRTTAGELRRWHRLSRGDALFFDW